MFLFSSTLQASKKFFVSKTKCTFHLKFEVYYREQTIPRSSRNPKKIVGLSPSSSVRLIIFSRVDLGSFQTFQHECAQAHLRMWAEVCSIPLVVCSSAPTHVVFCTHILKGDFGIETFRIRKFTFPKYLYHFELAFLYH
jgi:hypothetical protein